MYLRPDRTRYTGTVTPFFPTLIGNFSFRFTRSPFSLRTAVKFCASSVRNRFPAIEQLKEVSENEITTNLASAVWTTNLPPPVVVGELNFVTNSISGTQQFFRLSQ